MNEIKCPYCKHEHEATMDIESDNGEWWCDNCEKQFQVQLEYDPVYHIQCAEGNHEYKRYNSKCNECVYCNRLELLESEKDHRSKSGSYKMQFVGISKERKEV